MRPLEFSEKEAIENLEQIFWKLGFSGASLSSLQQVTGLSKGSLYNSFENKEKMFKIALSAYLEKVAAFYTELLGSSTQLPLALRNLFFGIVEFATKQPRGCFLLVAATEINELSPETRKLIEDAYLSRQNKMTKFLKEHGLANAHTLSESLCTVIDGLLIASRRGRKAADLKKISLVTLERMGLGL